MHLLNGRSCFAAWACPRLHVICVLDCPRRAPCMHRMHRWPPPDDDSLLCYTLRSGDSTPCACVDFCGFRRRKPALLCTLPHTAHPVHPQHEARPCPGSQQGLPFAYFPIPTPASKLKLTQSCHLPFPAGRATRRARPPLPSPLLHFTKPLKCTCATLQGGLRGGAVHHAQGAVGGGLHRGGQPHRDAGPVHSHCGGGAQLRG